VRIIRFFTSSTRRKVFSGAAIALVVVSSAAIAAWVLTASNTPWKAKAGTIQAVTFSAVTDASVPGTLLPGGAGQPLVIQANNPNNTALEMKSGNNSVNVSTSDAGCTQSQFTVTLNGNLAGTPIPVGVSTIAAGDVSLNAIAPIACAGVVATAVLGSLSYGTPGP
jgi:hypothetical protein